MSPSALSSPDTSSRLAGRVRWALLGIVASMATIFVLVPFDAHIIRSNDLDYSWMLALHAAHASKSVFGKDMVFTYGPLGFVLAPVYYPETFTSLILYRLAIAVALLLVLFQIVQWNLKSWFASALWLGLLICCLATGRFGWNEDALPAIFAAAALMVEFEFASPPSTTICISVAMVAFLALAKASYFPLALIVCCAVCFDALARRQIVRCLIMAVTFVLALLIGWTILGHQSIRGTRPYITWLAEIIKGYPEAMVYGTKDQIAAHDMAAYGAVKVLMTGIIACCAAAFVVISVWNQIGRAGRGWIAVGALAAITFLIFKTTITRMDRAHLASGEAAILSLILIYTAAAESKSRMSRQAIKALAAIVIIVFIITVGGKTGRGIVLYPWSVAQQMLFSGQAAAVLIARGPVQENTAYAEGLSTIRTAAPGIAPGGNVDVYPWDAALAIALSDRYQPRPAFQSYQANTPALEQINALHLEGSDAPQRVLFKIDPIDGRFPNLDDSLSWPMLLSQYTPVGMAGEYAVLQSRPAPLHASLNLLSQDVVSMDQWVSIPETSGMLWAQMDINISAIGEVQETLLRPAALNLLVRQNDNHVTPYRMIRLTGAAGFLLSPVISDAADFVSLAKLATDNQANFANHRVIAIKLEAIGEVNRFFYQQKWTLRLFTLVIYP